MSFDSLNTNWVSGSYVNDRNFLLEVAENNGLRLGTDLSGLHAQFDGNNSIAIGYGIDLLVNSNATLSGYFSNSTVHVTFSSTDQALLTQARATRSTAISNIAAINASVKAGALSQNAGKSQIATISAGLNASLRTIAGELNLNLGSEPTAVNLLNVVANEKELQFNQFLANNNIELGDSRERAALLSMYYQTPAYFIGKGGGLTRLSQALVSGNRAEAWFEIRYDSNGNALPGIAKRRYFEADYFGLYANPNAATQTEMFQAYEMLTLNRAAIIKYENTWGTPPTSSSPSLPTKYISSANADYSPNAIVGTIVSDFNAAEVELFSYLGGEYSILSNLNIKNYLSTNVYINPEQTSPTALGQPPGPILASYNDDLSAASSTQSSILMGGVGNDTLTGDSGNGSDILIAGAGNDSLKAGNGTDTLIGGAGNDTLVGFSGSNDTFVYSGKSPSYSQTPEIDNIESDGSGTVYSGSTQLKGPSSNAKASSVTTPQGQGIQWVEQGQPTYQFVPNVNNPNIGTLTITGLPGATGGEIVIPNFNTSGGQNPNGFLGIQLTLPTLTPGGNTVPLASVPQNTAVNATGDSYSFTVSNIGDCQTAQTYTITATGNGATSDQLRYGTGSASLANGSATVTIPAGQDSVTVTLVDPVVTSVAQTVSLTATLNDSSSDSTPTSNSLAITFNGTPTTTNSTVITGTTVQLPTTIFSTANEVTGTQYLSAGLDTGATNINYSVTCGAGLNYVDLTSSFNQITPGQSLTGPATNVITGGGGQDIFMLSQGSGITAINTQVYAGSSVVSLSTALTQAQSAIATHTLGDWFAVGDGNNTIVGGNGDDMMTTGAGNNVIVCGPGADTVLGGGITNAVAVNWTHTLSSTATFGNYGVIPIAQFTNAQGGTNPQGAVNFNGSLEGLGNDTIYGGKGNSYYDLPDGNNYLDAGGGNDYITGAIGNDTIFGGAGNDTIEGGGNDYIDAESGSDLIVGMGGNATIFGGTGNDTIWSGDNQSDWATSTPTGNSYLDAESGNTKLSGAGGNDTLMGGSGNDTLFAGAGNEYLEAGTGNTTMVGGAGNDTIVCGSGNDSINAGDGNTTITGGSGWDVILGGKGNDSITTGDGGTDAAFTQVTAGTGNTTITGGAGVDHIQGGSGTNVLNAGDGGDVGLATQVIAGAGATTITGGAGIDALFAGSGSDLITAGSGTTSIMGGSGTDTMVAGSGTDQFFGGSGKSTYQINSGSGNVSIYNAAAGDVLRFGAGMNIANVTAAAGTFSNGQSGIVLTFNNGTTVTIAQGALSQATFGDGTTATFAQLLSSQFTIGNTTYASANTPLPPVATQTQAAKATQATQTHARDGAQIRTNKTTPPATPMDYLVLRGTADLQGMGNNVNDVITANAGNDTLIAGTASDTMIGGGGSETYVVGAGTGTVTTINTSTSADNLIFTGTVTLSNITVSTASAANGSLIVTLQNNQGGSVVVNGDTSGNILDQITFSDGSTASLGELLAQLTTGPTAATSAATVTLATGIQNMTLTGSANISATGNAQDNVITANTGHDTLIAGTALDTLIGGGGTASYVFNRGDTNVTITNSGSSDTLVFGAGITESDLTTSSAVVNGVTVVTITDNQGGQVIVQGGALNNVSFADGSTATLTQLLGSSYIETPTLYSTVSTTAGAGITAIDLTGSANISATANTLNDVITANSGNDTLNAGTGNDTLIGNVGSNTYVIAPGTQVTTIEQSGVFDTLSFGAGVSLANLSATAATVNGATVITLTNSLGGSVVIDASVDGPLDQISFANGSTASLSAILAQATTGITAATSAASVTLATGIQNMLLTGSASVTATGNGVDDVITSNSGSDTLIAGSASDTLVGGSGATTYEFNIGNIITITHSGSNDKLVVGAGITESDLTTSSAIVNGVTVVTIVDNQGGSVAIDGGGLNQVSFADGSTATLTQLLAPSYTVGATIYSTISTIASAGMTNIDLTGNASISATANSTGDVIQANSGNDTLIAGSGNDTLIGNSGVTTYVTGTTSGTTTIEQAGASDILSFGTGIIASNLIATAALAADGSTTVTIANRAGNDSIIINDYVSGSADQLVFADGSTGSLGAVLAQSMSGITAASSAVNVTLAEGIQNMDLTGSANLQATGNDEDDVITTNGGNDTLISGTANDTFVGGGGGLNIYEANPGSNVTIVNGSSTDILAFGTGVTQSDLVTGIVSGNGYYNELIVDTLGGSATIVGTNVPQIGIGGSVISLSQLPSSLVSGTTLYSFANATATAGIVDVDLLGNTGITATANTLNDVITANAGSDTLISGSGNDTMVGSSGTTTYVIGTGSGVTTIAHAGKSDVLSFGAEINLGNLSASATIAPDGSTTLTITDSVGSAVVINDYVSGLVDQLSFANGRTYSLGALLAQATTGPTAITSASSVILPANIQNLTLTGSGNLTATGNSISDVITANSGNDSLIAGTAADTLVAGTGNDTMTGGTGATTYAFNPQSGDTASRTLTINNSGANDTLAFGAGILPSAITASTATTNGLTVTTLTVGQYGTVTINGGGLSQFSLTNGEVLTLNDLMPATYVSGATQYSSTTATLQPTLTNLVLTGVANANGTANALNDVLTANGGNDSLIGGSGNDTLIAGGGNDTLIAGSGTDSLVSGNLTGNGSGATTFVITTNIGPSVVIDAGPNDTLQFGPGFNLSTIKFVQSNGQWLIQFYNGGPYAVTVNGPLGYIGFPDGGSTPLASFLSGNYVDNTNQVSNISTVAAPGVTNLTLTGTGNLTAMANNLNDMIIADYVGNTTLIGGSGNDTLRADGNDSLVGGSGNTTFDLNTGLMGVISQSKASDVLELAYSNGQTNDVTALLQAVAAGTTDTAVLLANGTTQVEIGALDIVVGTQPILNQVVFLDGTSTTIDAILAANSANTISTSSNIVLPVNVVSAQLTGTGNLTATGNALNDIFTGNSGNDTFIGGTGSDSINVGSGSTGTSTLVNGTSSDVIEFGYTAPTSIVASSVTTNGVTVVTLQGAQGGTAIIDGGTSEVGFENGSIYTVNQLLGIAPITTTSSSNVRLSAGVTNLTLTGNANLTATGNNLSDVITGNSGADTLIAGTANDTLIGGNGGPTEYVVNAAADNHVTIINSLGSDVLNVTGTSSNPIATSTINNGVTDINLYFGSGNSVEIAGGGLTQVNLNGVNTTVSQLLAQSNVTYSAASVVLPSTSNSAVLTGNGNLSATTNSNVGNVIVGNSGNDTLTAAGNNDTLIGGTGNDTFVLNNNGDVISEAPNTGNNTEEVTASAQLAANVQNLTALGNNNATLTGNNLANVITANNAIDILVAGTANATLVGGQDTEPDYETYMEGNNGLGAITYLVNLNNCHTSISNTGSADILEFGTGITPANISATSTGTGSATVVTLAVAGAYPVVINNPAFTQVSFAGGTTTTIAALLAQTAASVSSSVSIVMPAGATKLTLTGSSSISGTGNNLADTIIANSGNDTLIAGSGLATLIGGSGNDTFVVDNASDVITVASAKSGNVVQSSVSYVLPTNLLNLTGTGSNAITLTGNTSADKITANSGADTLVAGAGVATLVGGTGNDTFVINNASDVVTEATNTGKNIEQTSVSATLAANVENLVGTGNAAITLTGSTTAGTITANNAADTLVAGTGIVTLVGGTGNDIFVINNASDVITEATNTGNNTEQSSVSTTLAANVQNLTGTSTGNLTLTGNTLANTITANTGADTLISGTGIDTLVGGTGNDTFVINNSSDAITVTSAKAGNMVQSSVNYVLPANLLNLTGTNSAAISLTGNTLADKITANTGADTLISGSGVDTLVGGTGNDTFVINNSSDTITVTTAKAGNVVQSNVNYVLPTNLLNLTGVGTNNISLTGNASADTITANSGADTLIAGSGLATLIGGSGNDIFVINNASDVITKATNTGNNTEQTSVTATLAANVQNLTGTGSNSLTLTGNTLNDVITGNTGTDKLVAGSGNDTLTAGSGIDTLTGGAGNDVFNVNNTADVVTATSGTNVNTINTSVSYTASTNVQDLFVTGSGTVTATGNTGNDLIIGSTGANTLVGGSGVSVLEAGSGATTLKDAAAANALIGGAGNDTMTGGTGTSFIAGGAGNDAITLGAGTAVVAFNTGNGAATIVAGSGLSNVLSLGGGIAYANLTFSKSGNNLILKTGGNNAITFTNWYAGAADQNFVTMQVLEQSASTYSASSSNVLYNSDVEEFSFTQLVAAFNAALAATPTLTSWNLTNALLTDHLSSSNTAALGGDLAYYDGLNGNLTGMNLATAVSTLQNATYGKTAQTVDAWSGISAGSNKLH